MKINVEFDLTPAEFRQSLGLPDVEAFQHDLMARIQQQMEAGVEGYDPWSLMQPFLQQGNLRRGEGARLLASSPTCPKLDANITRGLHRDATTLLRRRGANPPSLF